MLLRQKKIPRWMLERFFPLGTRRRRWLARGKRYLRDLVSRLGGVRFVPLKTISGRAYRRWLPSYESSLVIETDKADVQIIECFRLDASDSISDLLSASSAPVVIFIFAPVVLAQAASESMGAAIEAGSSLVYGDDDFLDARGRRERPRLRPAWSRILAESGWYLGEVCACSRASVLAGLDAWRGASGDLREAVWRLALNLPDTAIRHLPRVLAHIKQSTDCIANMYRYAILPAQGIFLGEPIPATRRVAIIIPNRDQPEMLARCLGSIRKFTDMQTVEIIIVENGSHDPATFALYREQEILGDFRLLTWTGTFNYSAINNFAAKESDSDLILFLNNDIEILNEDWLMRLAAWTKRADLGIVGPTLLYPDGRLQHAGMVLGMVGSAGHLYRFAQQGESGYLDLLQDARDVGALTGACLMLRRDIFALVGGFDEGLAVTCNDTDLCLRIHAAGLRVVWTPEVCLLHHESVSRGHDRTAEQRARLENENAYLMGRWAHLMQQYEPLAHPAFVMEREDDLYVRLTRRQGR